MLFHTVIGICVRSRSRWTADPTWPNSTAAIRFRMLGPGCFGSLEFHGVQTAWTPSSLVLAIPTIHGQTGGTGQARLRAVGGEALCLGKYLVSLRPGDGAEPGICVRPVPGVRPWNMPTGPAALALQIILFGPAGASRPRMCRPARGCVQPASPSHHMHSVLPRACERIRCLHHTALVVPGLATRAGRYTT